MSVRQEQAGVHRGKGRRLQTCFSGKAIPQSNCIGQSDVFNPLFSVIDRQIFRLDSSFGSTYLFTIGRIRPC